MKAEIEQHSYSHQVGFLSKIDDIKKGIKAHEKIIGSPPMGYRAPQGIITEKEALFLEDNGIKFDSSIFPGLFPGRYNRINFPTFPHKLNNSNLI
jgi:peptidoglycan/xylan/chitin deacetylase (PgdA/CDA1 family)